MRSLNTLENMVREVLKRNPEARDDDRVLTLEIWTRIFGISPWMPVSEAMLDKELPSQESIGRCRRKIQQTDESLRGSKAKEAIRMEAFTLVKLEQIEQARITNERYLAKL